MGDHIMNKAKIDFTIHELDKGFIVTVGCKQIATDKDLDTVLKELRQYSENPTEVQREYFPEDFLQKEAKELTVQMNTRAEQECSVPVPAPTYPEPHSFSVRYR